MFSLIKNNDVLTSKEYIVQYNAVHSDQNSRIGDQKL